MKLLLVFIVVVLASLYQEIQQNTITNKIYARNMSSGMCTVKKSFIQENLCPYDCECHHSQNDSNCICYHKCYQGVVNIIITTDSEDIETEFKVQDTKLDRRLFSKKFNHWYKKGKQFDCLYDVSDLKFVGYSTGKLFLETFLSLLSLFLIIIACFYLFR